MERNDLFYVIIIGFILVSVFVLSLGKDNPLRRPEIPSVSTGTSYTNPSSSSGQGSDLSYQEIKALEESGFYSKYKDKVFISSVSGRGGDIVEEEYITLRTSINSGEKIPITGWKIKGARNKTEIIIGLGSKNFLLNKINPQEVIYLVSGDTAYINTGHISFNTSFKTNKCSGYLAETKTFIPSISSGCPDPEDEVVPFSYNQTTASCFEYIKDIPECKAQIFINPAKFGNMCSTFIQNTFSYNGCVNAHKNDSDFDDHEWRIFLNKKSSIWGREKDKIELIDTNGKIVDTYTYGGYQTY